MRELETVQILEQLEELQHNFEVLEKKISEQGVVLEIIHSTFQKIHSIKNSLFLKNSSESLKLIYLMECHFEKLRTGENRLKTETLCLFKKCLSWIMADISESTASEKDSLKLMAELTDLEIRNDASKFQSAILNLTGDEKALLRDARNSGLNIFFINYPIDSSISREDSRNLEIVKLINSLGLIVLQALSREKIGDERSSLKIIFVTDKKISELNDPLLKTAISYEEDLLLSSLDYKILIVEDNPIASLLQKSIMSTFGVSDAVSDGVTALELFRLSLKENSPYDIILLDLVMPGIGGADVLKQIRELEEQNNIKGLERTKVITLTTSRDSSTLMDLFRAETDAYIIKPLTKDKIEKELKNIGLI